MANLLKSWVAITEKLQQNRGLKPLKHRLKHQGDRPNLMQTTKLSKLIARGLLTLIPMLVIPAALGIPRISALAGISEPLIVAQNQLSNPKFAGFDNQPRRCDLRIVNGWFYWYRQGETVCTIVPSSSQEDATVKAQELAESSNVTEAGIGYRLLGDPFY